MGKLEQMLVLFVAAVILAAAASPVGAPYPYFLHSGACLGFLPGAPAFAVPPELALALFVAPVLLDAAYDTSVRDLRDNWAPVFGLVIFVVGFTTAAVAVVAHTLIPAIPWAAAIALGAIVAPPDAVAATAVLRPLRPPHRLLTILEGESLLNDASALLIYRLALGARRGQLLLHRGGCPCFLARRGPAAWSWPGAWMAGDQDHGPCAPRADFNHSSVRLDVRSVDPRRTHRALRGADDGVLRHYAG